MRLAMFCAGGTFAWAEDEPATAMPIRKASYESSEPCGQLGSVVRDSHERQLPSIPEERTRPTFELVLWTDGLQVPVPDETDPLLSVELDQIDPQALRVGDQRPTKDRAV